MTSGTIGAGRSWMVRGKSIEGATTVMKRRYQSMLLPENQCKGTIMLRSIGSVTFLALLMVGCGGGGGDSSSPPPPPPPATYSIGGTVSGLVGSGLTLAICVPPSHGVPGYPICGDPTHIGANGTYTLGTVSVPIYGGPYVSITQQPSSPPQSCDISNRFLSDQAASGTGFTVSCADYLAHFYVANAADNTLLAYSIDATTGVAALIGAPTVTGASPYATVGFTFADNKRGSSCCAQYVFVGDEGSHEVSAFTVDPTTGALTAVPGSPIAAGTDPQALAVLQFAGADTLYVANAGSNNVSAYTIDSSTGALTEQQGSPVAVGGSPTSIVLDFNGGLGVAYVANHGGSNDISAFFMDLTPVPGSPFHADGSPLSLALGPQGRFLYSANPDAKNPSISGFSVDLSSGALTPLSGSPFLIPVSHYIATDQTGAYLYVTLGASIVGYAIDATTGALTQLQGFPVATGANAYSITVDPTNRILYVANYGAANVSGFTLDASTGALTPMRGSPFPTGDHPGFIATF
jgi:6-phosphogluconolactonase